MMFFFFFSPQEVNIQPPLKCACIDTGEHQRAPVYKDFHFLVRYHEQESSETVSSNVVR